MTLYSGFTLIDFLTKLFIPCAIFIVLLVFYTIWWIKRYNKKSPTTPLLKNNEIRDIIVSSKNATKIKYMPEILESNAPPPPKIPPFLHERHINVSRIRKVYLPILSFISFIFFICIAPFYNISISYISIIYIGILLIVAIEKADLILNTVSVLDSLVFIAALFMISSALEHYGILKIAVDYIISFTGDSKILILLSILISAFVISTFLSAGPAAATILPICLQLNPIVGHNLVYAALALGILAGSSMLPWSATGGPILLNETGRYLHTNTDLTLSDSLEINKLYDLKKYISFSIPFSLIILLLSSLFLQLYLVIF